MAGFIEATSATRCGDHCEAMIDPEWFIWGPFGGYLAAIALRAMAAHSIHPRPATFSCQYLNVGAAGPVTIEIDHRKSGRRAGCVSASIAQGGKRLIDAQAWFVADDIPGLEHTCTLAPAAPAPRLLEPWAGGNDDENRSAMWQHIERRPAVGYDVWGRAGAEPRWVSWLKLSQTLSDNDLALQAARATLWMDLAPWNAVLMAHGWPTTHLAPTLDLTVQFQPNLYELSIAKNDWLLAETISPVARRGLFGAGTTLWSECGRLVAVSTAQAMCVPNPSFSDQIAQPIKPRNHEPD